MKVILSKFSGYCYGVKRAVDIANKNIDKFHDIKSLGYIIHNKKAIDKLVEKGLVIVDDISEKSKNVIFRSHGVEKKFYDFANSNEVNIIDTTCIYVKKIHDIVNGFYNKGYKIVIVGNREHPEVVGINSWCDYKGIFIENVAEIDNINWDIDSEYIVVFQTTYNIEMYDLIVEKLNRKLDNIKIYNTICSATKKRQDSALQVSENVDIMVVVGDKKSSNSKKLYEISKTKCKSIFIEDVNQLDASLFENIDVVGVTAGASTPDFIIDEVLNFLENI